MRVILPLSAWILVGCVDQRIEALERDIRDLQLAVEDMQADRRAMEQAVRTAQAEGRLIYNRNPEGWDPTLPLPAGDPARPDVILLSVDTLRADHLGVYGYERATSPYIDELAARGTRFANTWSPAPWTLPSHTTMLSGQLTSTHGVIEDHLKIPADVGLIQEVFQGAGYATAGVTATLFVSSKFGFERGFDSFEDFDITDTNINNLATVNAENVFANATDWAQKQEEGKPVFLFLHVYDVHYQYSPPEPWNEKFDRPGTKADGRYKNYEHYLRNPVPDEQLAHQMASYDEEIAYVDDQLRQFLERWEASGRKAYFAITSDHGEEFAERGSWGHGHTLYPEQLHVPLVVVGPDVKRQVVTARAGTEDIAPTLAGLAGLALPNADGQNHAAGLRGGRIDGAGVPAPFADTSRFDTNRIRWHSPPYDLYADLVSGEIRVCDTRKDPTCRTLVDDPAIAAKAAAGLQGFLGDPWGAKVDGTVKVEAGVVYNGRGAPLASLPVIAGAKFTILPGDAQVTFTAADGTVSGPFQPLGGKLPAPEDPLTFGGRVIGEGVVLTDDDKAMLESLGYVMDDDEEDPAPAKAKTGKGKAKAKAAPVEE